MDPFLNETNTKIDNALKHLQKELASIRAGKANPAILEEVHVQAYGSQMKLMELGTISAPQPNLLTVTVWDPSVIKDIEKAILESNLGLTPAIDGTTIRLPFPPLTEERREEYVKMTSQKGEQTKIEIRQIRGEIRENWSQNQKEGHIGEDELKRREKILQDLIDQSTATVDEYVKAKIEELRQV